MPQNLTEEEVINNNKNLVFAIVNTFNPSENDFDDYVQHGLIALLRACRTYDPQKYGTKFSTHAHTCITRELISLIKKQNKKHRDIPTDDKLLDIFNTNIKNDNINDILPSTLTTDEVKTIKLKLSGYTFEQIGKILGNYSRGWANKLYVKAIAKIREANE